jgi:signal transduction histidine kinase
MRIVRLEPRQQWTAIAGVAMLVALAIALIPHRPAVFAILPAAFGVACGAARYARASARLLKRHRILLLVPVLTVLLVAWCVAGAITASRPWSGYYGIPNGTLFPYLYGLGGRFAFSDWPWRVGRLPLPALVIALLCTFGGFILVADAVRVQIGLAHPSKSGWRSLSATPTRGGRIAIRAIPGLTLIGLATFLAISLANKYTEFHPIESLVSILAISVCAAVLLASPILIGMYLQLDIDKEERAREQERRRLAAHLHDSVLQTLALIQRQASDPAAVSKLARRQEIALRAWMAGDSALSSATIVGAVKDMVLEVEDEQGITVELTIVGDAPINAQNVELVSAAREALRNAARHAPGAPVNIFLDVGASGVELFVRDGGPGFEFETIPAERRGLRDAVIGRMLVAGGSATVDSNIGEGTEVALKLPSSGLAV